MVLFAIIGIFIGIILGAMIIQNIMRRHARKLWLKQQTKKYIVKDFQNNLDELRNLSTTRPTTLSSISNLVYNNNNNTNLHRPTAPVEVLSTNKIKYTTS